MNIVNKIESKQRGYITGDAGLDIIKSLASLGKEDMDEIIADGKPVEVKCQFCNEAYEFSIEDLKTFRRK